MDPTSGLGGLTDGAPFVMAFIAFVGLVVVAAFIVFVVRLAQAGGRRSPSATLGPIDPVVEAQIEARRRRLADQGMRDTQANLAHQQELMNQQNLINQQNQLNQQIINQQMNNGGTP